MVRKREITMMVINMYIYGERTFNKTRMEGWVGVVGWLGDRWGVTLYAGRIRRWGGLTISFKS